MSASQDTPQRACLGWAAEAGPSSPRLCPLCRTPGLEGGLMAGSSAGPLCPVPTSRQHLGQIRTPELSGDTGKDSTFSPHPCDEHSSRDSPPPPPTGFPTAFGVRPKKGSAQGQGQLPVRVTLEVTSQKTQQTKEKDRRGGLLRTQMAASHNGATADRTRRGSGKRPRGLGRRKVSS